MHCSSIYIFFCKKLRLSTFFFLNLDIDYTYICTCKYIKQFKICKIRFLDILIIYK